MKMNPKATSVSHKVRSLSTYELAQRTLLACMLGEDNFYEDGVSVMKRLASYVPELSEDDCRELLKMAKVDNKLRHAPIFWAVKMLKQGYLKADDVELITDRVDLMADLLAHYFAENTLSEAELRSKYDKHGNRIGRVNRMVPKQVIKGLQKSLKKFDEYQLAKYKGKDDSVKLSDVIKLVRAKPDTDEQSDLWKRAINNELKTPETWEVLISACGSDSSKKKEVWTKLLTEKNEKGIGKLGSLALLRNLRNMKDVGVDENIIRKALSEASMKKILPFQIIGASRFYPEITDVLENKLLESMSNFEKLAGDTLFLVDVSGSMTDPLSAKSELTRAHAGAGLAAILQEICENAIIYKFNKTNTAVPKSYRGFALVDNILSQVGGGTAIIDCTNDAIRRYREAHNDNYPARVIVITDDQTNSDGSYRSGGWYGSKDVHFEHLPKTCKGYIVNIGVYGNGVGYEFDSCYTHISGWSDGIVRYITESEKFSEK